MSQLTIQKAFDFALQMEEAKELLENDMVEKALVIYNKYVNHKQGLLGMALCKELQGKFTEAMKLREKAVLINNGYSSS